MGGTASETIPYLSIKYIKITVYSPTVKKKVELVRGP